jgi:hypothetical protein
MSQTKPSFPILKLLDLVVLKEDLPDRALHRGEIGTVVEIFDHEAYEVEFIDDEGQTQAMLALSSAQLLPLTYSQYDLIEDIKTIYLELQQIHSHPTESANLGILDQTLGLEFLNRIGNDPSLSQRMLKFGKTEGAMAALEVALNHSIAQAKIEEYLIPSSMENSSRAKGQIKSRQPLSRQDG